MATTRITLTNAWQEIATIKNTSVLITGSEYWVNNGATIPAANSTAYFPINIDTVFYSYNGTEKTFARKAPGTQENSMDIAVIPII